MTCDRCGGSIRRTARTAKLVERTDATYSERQADLCRSCYQRLAEQLGFGELVA
jgi:hypothetical protein